MTCAVGTMSLQVLVIMVSEAQTLWERSFYNGFRIFKNIKVDL